MTTQTTLISIRQTGATPTSNTKKLAYEEWMAKVILNIQDIWNDRGEFISFPELKNKVGRAPHQRLEYNAVKAAFDQARKRSRLHLFEDEEQKPMSMTMGGHQLKAVKFKDFRKLLNKETQSCATSFSNKKLNVAIDHRHWETVFNSTKEILQWKILLGGFFLAREDFGRMLDNSFPACTFFFF